MLALLACPSGFVLWSGTGLLNDAMMRFVLQFSIPHSQFSVGLIIPCLLFHAFLPGWRSGDLLNRA